MTERFSKAKLLADLQTRYDGLKRQWNFDPNNGWAQVIGDPIERIVAYGAFDALESLIDEYRP